MDLRIGRKRVRCGSFAWWCCVAVGVAMLYMVMPFVWSTHLGARTLAVPLTRLAWRWASAFNL